MSDEQLHEKTKKPSHALAMTIVLVFLLSLGSFIVHPKSNEPDFGMINSAANGAIGEAEDSIDVLFIGDSEAFSSFSPLQMWHEKGFTSYVCATSAQQLPYGNTLLRRATTTQHPKVVVFETNSIYAPFSLNDSLMRAIQDVLPIFEFHDRWKHLTPSDFTDQPQATWTDDLKDFYLVKSVKPADSADYMKPTDDIANIPWLNERYLEHMIGYCRSLGATPLLVSVPSTKNWNMAKHNGMSAWAKENDIAYIDFNLAPYEIDINWETDTRDAGDHLNYFGAEKLTEEVGDLLDARYMLPDHRGDDAFSSWDEKYEQYVELVSK